MRWVHRAYAFLLGYFWLPCPTCGREFGGHQWRDRRGLSSCVNVVELAEWETWRGFVQTRTVRRGICPSCTRAGLGDPHIPGGEGA